MELANLVGRRLTSEQLRRPFAIAALLFPLAAFAENPRIFVESEPLRGNKAEIVINGKRAASVGPDEPYRGTLEPGRTVVETKGDKLEFDAEPDKEYRILVDMRPGGFAFGLIGSSAMATFTLKLQRVDSSK